MMAPTLLADLSAPALELRPYQREALAAVDGSYAAGHRAGLIVLPTGCGKTVIFSELVRRWNVPTLILAHREELLVQARNKLQSVWPDADAGILGAGYNEAGHHVTIASVQTLTRAKRLASYLDGHAPDLVIVDEAHHTPAASYLRILEALGAGQPGGAYLLGVTATPQRADGQSLANIYGAPVYVATLPQMVLDGYLADLRGLRIVTTTSLDGVHSRGGDFAEGELAAVVDTPDRNAQIVATWRTYAQDRLTAVFCATVKHAEHLADEFTAEGIAAAVVTGETPQEERRQVLADFAAGVVRVVCNVGVLTEGWDCPETACIVLARPTRSQGLYIQCVGRGARPAPGKRDCLVLDVVDASSRHHLVQLPDLVGGAYSAKRPVRTHDVSKATEPPKDEPGYSVRETLLAGPAQVQEASLMRQWDWVRTGDGGYLLELDRPRVDLVLELVVGHGFMPWRVEAHRDERLAPHPLPLGWAQSIAEHAAELLEQGQGHLLNRDAPWRSQPASPKQLNTLQRLRIRHAAGITKGHASDLLEMFFARGRAS